MLIDKPSGCEVIWPGRLQGLERGRQVPSGKRRRLIQRAHLLLDQGQIVDRLEDRVLTLIGPGMAGD